MRNSQQATLLDSKRNYLIIKKTTDKCIALLGICLLFPILMLVFLSIKIMEPDAPVFFKQVRNGKDKKEFEIYKFRTMHVNAEERITELAQFNEVEGAMFKMKNDPRITKIGGFLRKTSLDEFPQLINVLKGEMAIVGPRPPLPSELDEYTDYDMRRMTVIPGCTGLWQVNGRSNLSFNEMVELDLVYIRKMSMWLDLKIIVKTFFVILVPKNGY